MKLSKKDALILILTVSIFLIAAALPFVFLFRAGTSIAVICVLLITIILLIAKYGFSSIERIMLRIIAYCISAQFFWGVTSAILQHSLIRLSWIVVLIMLALLAFISSKNKSLVIDKYYIAKNCILSAVCFGILPMTLYFTSFYTLDNNYMYDKYFDNAGEVQAVLSNIGNFDELDTNVFDFTNFRSFSQSVYENEDEFLSYCLGNGSIVNDCVENQISPADIYYYFVTYTEVFNRFDMNFIIFGFATGILFFCLYHNYVNKNRKQILIFGILIVTFMYFSTFSDGAIIYWILSNVEISNQPVPISVDDVYAIQEMLKGVSIVFGVFIAIDRVYKIQDA